VTTVRLGKLVVPTAPLGPPSPLPPLDPPVAPIAVRDGVPADIASRTRTGAPPTLVPYLLQDDYSRELTPLPLRVAVLESERVRATVALDLGGRLWSLQVDGRELLYVNPVVQPANLALRNAWCSGGVEWNVGTRGHSPTTMSTLHAARVVDAGGGERLRLWEWERIRDVVFQIDLWVPGDAPVLAATVRLRNVAGRDVPMYWWTNAAVVATAGTRVLAPATRAFRTEYPAAVRVAPIPVDGGVDVTWPEHDALAADYFFDVGDDPHPWVAAVEADGRGTFHRSTAELRGRKLFVWGTSRGGPRWQRWLSHGGEQRYAEIQAGLAPTQFEHVTMPAGAEWTWTEVFGPVVADPAASHGDDWSGAVAATRAAIGAVATAERLDAWHAAGLAGLDAVPADIVAVGSGWGALERRRRAATGEAWFDDRATPFPDDALGPEQAPWLRLLDTSALPDAGVEVAPASYVAGGDWDDRLTAAPPTWLTELHRAVIAHGRADAGAARPHYERSTALAPNAWAERGLAEVARQEGRAGDAAEHAVSAARRAPGERHLAAEAVGRLLDAGRAADALALVDSLPDAIREHGRLRLLTGFAAVDAGDVERARAILDAGLEIADLREGERTIDQLWTLAFGDRPLPPAYDFRMH